MVIVFLLYKDIAHTAQIAFNPDIQQMKYVKFLWPFVLAFVFVSGSPALILLKIILRMCNAMLHVTSCSPCIVLSTLS